jgi:hypothetical protein
MLLDDNDRCVDLRCGWGAWACRNRIAPAGKLHLPPLAPVEIVAGPGGEIRVRRGRLRLIA